MGGASATVAAGRGAFPEMSVKRHPTFVELTSFRATT